MDVAKQQVQRSQAQREAKKAGAGAWVKVIPTATMLTSTDPVHVKSCTHPVGIETDITRFHL